MWPDDERNVENGSVGTLLSVLVCVRASVCVCVCVCVCVALYLVCRCDSDAAVGTAMHTRPTSRNYIYTNCWLTTIIEEHGIQIG